MVSVNDNIIMMSNIDKYSTSFNKENVKKISSLYHFIGYHLDFYYSNLTEKCFCNKKCKSLLINQIDKWLHSVMLTPFHT